MIKIQKFKTKKHCFFHNLVLNIGIFGIRICFGFRISCLEFGDINKNDLALLI
jgi:hypothetical protein